jgi:hypothetical protein
MHSVESKGRSDTFVVHGQTCVGGVGHSRCSRTDLGALPEGRSYTIDITDIMTTDLRVRHPTTQRMVHVAHQQCAHVVLGDKNVLSAWRCAKPSFERACYGRHVQE